MMEFIGIIVCNIVGCIIGFFIGTWISKKFIWKD